MMLQSVRAMCPGRGTVTGALVSMAWLSALQPSVVSHETQTCLSVLSLTNVAFTYIFVSIYSFFRVFTVHVCEEFFLLVAFLLLPFHKHLQWQVL